MADRVSTCRQVMYPSVHWFCRHEENEKQARGGRRGRPADCEKLNNAKSSNNQRQVYWLGCPSKTERQLGIQDFALQFWLREIGEITVRHRMAADLKTLRVELAHLAGIEVTGRAQESSGEVEGCVEAKLAEHRCGGDNVGLAAIVKGHTNARLRPIAQSFADIQASQAGFFHPRHLAAEGFERQNVAHVAWLGLAELAASELELVGHQEHNTR